jgi:BirA family biotin operon repressor/biotin-[acetyl-CoA-carboxylase] ligase
MDENTLHQALKGLALGGLRYCAQTGSTNDDAAAWQRAGAPHLALVVAGEQTAGRGRDGRTWHSPAGSSLAFSLVLRPAGVRSASLPRFTALGALAVCRALRSSFGRAAQIKWPNDVLIERQKVAGVLAEALWLGDDLEAVILGIGINLIPDAVQTAARSEGGLRFPAASIDPDGKHPVEAEKLLAAILAELISLLEQIETPAFLAEWQARLAFLSETVQIAIPNGGQEILSEGRIMGLQADGALMLQMPDLEILTAHAGEIRLRP